MKSSSAYAIQALEKKLELELKINEFLTFLKDHHYIDKEGKTQVQLTDSFSRVKQSVIQELLDTIHQIQISKSTDPGIQSGILIDSYIKSLKKIAIWKNEEENVFNQEIKSIENKLTTLESKIELTQSPLNRLHYANQQKKRQQQAFTIMIPPNQQKEKIQSQVQSIKTELRMLKIDLEKHRKRKQQQKEELMEILNQFNTHLCRSDRLQESQNNTSPYENNMDNSQLDDQSQHSQQEEEKKENPTLIIPNNLSFSSASQDPEIDNQHQQHNVSINNSPQQNSQQENEQQEENKQDASNTSLRN